MVALLALGGLYWQARSGPDPLTGAQVDKSIQNQLQRAQEEAAAQPPDATVVYQTIAPSLVHISVTRPGENGGADTNAIGAGTIVNADGTILTALHVVDGATSIKVTYADGGTSTAEVKESDAATDTASLTPADLPETVVPAVIGGGVQVGSDVFPVGDPLGLSTSLSAGVVSQLDRSVKVPGGRTLEGLIQFDAAVNPGNSGGPLLNARGQVVGVVTGLANPSSQPFFVGIGFAVPIGSAGGSGGPPQ